VESPVTAPPRQRPSTTLNVTDTSTSTAAWRKTLLGGSHNSPQYGPNLVTVHGKAELRIWSVGERRLITTVPLGDFPAHSLQLAEIDGHPQALDDPASPPIVIPLAGDRVIVARASTGSGFGLVCCVPGPWPATRPDRASPPRLTSSRRPSAPATAPARPDGGDQRW
jgi:hypothetical protein